MRLADLQILFQQGVLAGTESDDAAILGALKNSQRADRATLFAVYANSYRLRLSEFLAAEFPALRTLLGENAFGALAADYIAAAPSRPRSARSYAARLGEFMQSSENWRNEARAVDLARFERALIEASEAADAARLSLLMLEPGSWPKLKIAFHPSLSALELAAGTIETHEAATAGGSLPPKRGGKEFVAVWRSEEDTVYRELETDEFLALTLAMAGRVFGEVYETLASREALDFAPERLAQFLASWFEEGFVAALETGDAPHSSNTPSSA